MASRGISNEEVAGDVSGMRDSVERWQTVGYKFSLMLSREINDGETTVLREAGCSTAEFTTDAHPTSAEIAITKIDFNDTLSATLAEAIEAALEVVKQVPDLSVPGLTVPAQPDGTAKGQPGEATVKSEPGAESPE